MPLADRARAIYAAMETAAVEVGRQLLDAKAEHPREFMAWVDSELPFGLDRAERLMSICRTFENADDTTRASLPSAYFALYHLSRVPIERVVEAIETGEVHPDMKVREAEDFAQSHRSGSPVEPGGRPGPVELPEPEPSATKDRTYAADIIAGELMRHSPSKLSDDVTRELRRWLG